MVAQSHWGACAKKNTAGENLGGAGTDLPGWIVKSYVADTGDVKVPGTQLVPVDMSPGCEGCDSCCLNDRHGARKLRHN